MMPSQRACDAENQVRNTLSNGPLRAQSKAHFRAEYSATFRQTLYAWDMLVSCKVHGKAVNARWHRG